MASNRNRPAVPSFPYPRTVTRLAPSVTNPDLPRLTRDMLAELQPVGFDSQATIRLLIADPHPDRPYVYCCEVRATDTLHDTLIAYKVMYENPDHALIWNQFFVSVPLLSRDPELDIQNGNDPFDDVNFQTLVRDVS